MKKEIGQTLRKWRKQRGWSVSDVVLHLRDEYGLDVAEKTVYGWESDQAYPRTSTLLVLCELYQMENITDDLVPSSPSRNFVISPDERKLIEKYRLHPDLHEVINYLLEMPLPDKRKARNDSTGRQ